MLEAIGEHLQKPTTRHQLCNVAIGSGHGIGKSCLISMLIAWAMSTNTDTRAIITSNTEGQLRTKTRPEINKWFRQLVNASWFNLGATSATARAKGHERLWRTDAISWFENNTEAFAGLHNKGKRILLVFDEASSISDRIYEVSEGALTDLETEIIWIVCGDSTLNTGRFREWFGCFKHCWRTFPDRLAQRRKHQQSPVRTVGPGLWRGLGLLPRPRQRRISPRLERSVLRQRCGGCLPAL